ncbi:hypothetical protein FRB90_010592 [Tulasnella sp. 427]|nr:hypothetical protein FRB90_010592 [Tulasnella sp. 427]
MPDQRRSSSSRSARRPHSRTSSHTSVRQAGVGGMTAIDRSASRENAADRHDAGPSIAPRRKNSEQLPPPTASRTSSKETVPTLRKPATGGGKHVSIVSPSTMTKTTTVDAGEEEDDSDAWVSSESGAATPNVEPASPRRTIVAQAGDALGPTESRTPPATRQPLPPAEPFIRTPSPTDTARLHTQSQSQSHNLNRISARSSPGPERGATVPLPEGSASRSRASPQPHHGGQQHHHHHHHHHHGLHLQRPHPLIRGTSHSSALASPSYLTATPSVSTPISESPPAGSPPTSLAEMGRRLSISSSRSVSTLPIPNTATVSTFSASGTGGALSPFDYGRPRERTMSALSHSSAALSSLAAIPKIYGTSGSSGGSKGQSNAPLVSRFAPSEAEEDRHPLLRQPYLMDHVSVLQYYDPLHWSARRVAKARARVERG